VATGVEMTGALLTTGFTVEFLLTFLTVDKAVVPTHSGMNETMFPVDAPPSPLEFLFSPATDVAASPEGIVAVIPEVIVTVEASQASNGPVQFGR